MWSRTDKSEEKKAISQGWSWWQDLFAYIYDALVDGILIVIQRTSSSKPETSAPAKNKNRFRI